MIRNPDIPYFNPELLETLKRNMTMSETTWSNIFVADPTGWKEFLNRSSLSELEPKSEELK